MLGSRVLIRLVELRRPRPSLPDYDTASPAITTTGEEEAYNLLLLGGSGAKPAACVARTIAINRPADQCVCRARVAPGVPARREVAAEVTACGRTAHVENVEPVRVCDTT